MIQPDYLTQARNSYLVELQKFQHTLEKQPLYPQTKRWSDARSEQILEIFRSHNLNDGNCSLARMGSFVLGVANEGSDFEGTILFKRHPVFPHRVGDQIKKGLIKLGIGEPTLYVLEEDYQEKFIFADRTEPGYDAPALLHLIFGEYVIGQFRSEVLAGIINTGDHIYIQPEDAIEYARDRLIQGIQPEGEIYQRYLERLNPGNNRERIR